MRRRRCDLILRWELYLSNVPAARRVSSRTSPAFGYGTNRASYGVRLVPISVFMIFPFYIVGGFDQLGSIGYVDGFQLVVSNKGCRQQK